MHLNILVVRSAVHAFIIQSLICAAQNISEVLETIGYYSKGSPTDI